MGVGGGGGGRGAKGGGVDKESHTVTREEGVTSFVTSRYVSRLYTSSNKCVSSML